MKEILIRLLLFRQRTWKIASKAIGRSTKDGVGRLLNGRKQVPWFQVSISETLIWATRFMCHSVRVVGGLCREPVLLLRFDARSPDLWSEIGQTADWVQAHDFASQNRGLFFLSGKHTLGTMKKADRAGLRTWIEIDRKAIAHNYRQFRKLIGRETRLMAVAKSNAYGHYFVEYSQEMEKLGADWIGVDSISEGLALRREGIKLPILVLGYTLPEKMAEAAENNISLAIATFEGLKSAFALKIKEKQKPLKIHLKLDTGMRRHGFLKEDLPKLFRMLKKMPRSVEIEGVFSHLASKDPAKLPENRRQIEEFEAAKILFLEKGYRPLFHLTNSWGTLAYPECRYDMVRIGMSLYGHYPSDHSREAYEKKVPLRPILSWKSLLSEVKKLPEGSGIGYDLTEKLPKGSVVGLVPIGYWHGYPRTLSSKGSVLVKGKRAKVLGRVSMDILAVDLSKVPGARVGDEVVLIGTVAQEAVQAEDLARLTSTSAYEILTRINPLIKRFYV